MRAMDYLLVVFVPGRARLGALAAAFGKLGLQYVEGCAEPSARAAWAGRAGLLLTIVGWAPGARTRSKVTLPPAARDALLAVGGSPPGDAVEFAVVAPGGEVRGEARLGFGDLDRPVALGCRHVVAGTVAPSHVPPEPHDGRAAPGTHVDD
jgi:hypothetical protein